MALELLELDEEAELTHEELNILKLKRVKNPNVSHKGYKEGYIDRIELEKITGFSRQKIEYYCKLKILRYEQNALKTRFFHKNSTILTLKEVAKLRKLGYDVKVISAMIKR